MSAALRSPTTGLPLRREGLHCLTDGAERWPLLDGIPYLRVGREDLIRAVLDEIDAGRPERALVRLLADADDWWDGAPPLEVDLAALVAGCDRLSLREAMARLAYGRVADYFAHRWSDPTFLAGLALLDAHWAAPATAFELACGIGHYLRELGLRGVAVAGGDVVFSKLWVARHWVVGAQAELVCFDARAPWPVAERRYDLVLCQDAFYFLEPKPAIRDRLRGLKSPGGTLAIGHVHNSAAANHSAGAGVTAAGLSELFPDAVVYEDAELTRAAAAGRTPAPRPLADLAGVEAFALAEPARVAAAGTGGLTAPRPSAKPRRNPLYGRDGRLAWPSERYRDEYAALATYPATTALAEGLAAATPDTFRRREVVDLPERW